MRIFRLLPLLAVLAVLAAPAASPAAEPGLNINGGAAAGNDPAFSALGHGWNRYFAHWYTVEPEKGKFNQDVINAYRKIGKEDGKKTLFVLTGTPGWANGGASQYTPPTNADDFGSFARRFAEAMGDSAEAYEIWNEPDGESYWHDANRDDPSRYVSILKSSYAGIKAVAPNATVVFGPTTGNNFEYLAKAYAAGAKGSFDAMSVHTDVACLVDSPQHYYRENGKIARFTFLGYRTVREVMLANGDDKPIWMSELGWSNPPDISPTSCKRGMWAGKKPQGVSPQVQAQFLREAYHCLKEDPYVTVAMWFNSRDLINGGEELDNYGLLRFDGTKRPAYDAFRDIAAGIDTITGPCGDFVGPEVQILEPKPGQVIGELDSLKIRATSSEKQLLRLSFSIQNGGEIRNFTNKPDGQALPSPIDMVAGAPAECRGGCALDWQGARNLAFGQHTLVVTGLDQAGNVGTASVPFTRANPATMPIQKVHFGSRFKFAGKGLKRTISGQVSSVVPLRIGGKVKAEWQAKRKGKWKKVHGGLKAASKTFKFTQKLKYAGQWRVRVSYTGQRPFAKATSCWLHFRTTSTKTKQVCGPGQTKLIGAKPAAR